MLSKAGIKTKTEPRYKETTPDKGALAKKKKSRLFESYISKVLKQVSDKNGITSNSKQQLNSAICIVARTISLVVTRLTEIAKKKTISDNEVANAVRVLFSGDLAENSIHEGVKSVEKFSAEASKGSSRQGKAGIIFPPSIAEKFLRNFGYSNVRVTSTAPIFLAAVLEYLVAEVLILASKSATDNKRIRITIRDLQLSVGEDQELSTLFDKLNVSFLGGGVVPYINSCLVTKKPRKKKSNAVDTTGMKKPHRFRPGTVALREIKKFQKMSNCLIFAKFPFERFVRQVVKKNNAGMKISKDVFIIIQYFIEQYVVGILKDANAAAIHAGRVKLMITDIEFISSLRGLSTDGFLDNSVKPVKPVKTIKPVKPAEKTKKVSKVAEQVEDESESDVEDEEPVVEEDEDSSDDEELVDE